MQEPVASIVYSVISYMDYPHNGFALICDNYVFDLRENNAILRERLDVCVSFLLWDATNRDVAMFVRSKD